jgi:hypothetical protein
MTETIQNSKFKKRRILDFEKKDIAILFNLCESACGKRINRARFFRFPTSLRSRESCRVYG